MDPLEQLATNFERRRRQAIGFIEADGCIQLSKDGKVSIEVEQIDPRALFELQRVFGGNVTRRGTRDAWRWRVGARNEAMKVLSAVSDYGWTLKREQAQAALLYLNESSSLDVARRVLKHLKGDRPHRTDTTNVPRNRFNTRFGPAQV